MRFGIRYDDCGKRHKWFAWYPVQLENGETVWLDYVARRYEMDHYFSMMNGWSKGKVPMPKYDVLRLSDC